MPFACCTIIIIIIIIIISGLFLILVNLVGFFF